MRNDVDLAVKVSQHGPTHVYGFDEPSGARDFDHVTLPVLVLPENEDAIDEISNQVLGAEPHRDSSDAKPPKDGTDRYRQFGQDHEYDYKKDQDIRRANEYGRQSF